MYRLAFLSLSFLTTSLHAEEKSLKLLFLGDTGHHKPAERFRQLQPVLAGRGIDLVYTEKLEALDAKTLAPYDGLILYANHTKITPEQEEALLDFVAGGKGFIPLHCASACFGNSAKYIDLVGAQFQKHGTGTFRTTVAAPDHPVMKGFKSFESWDETYQHSKHNEKDRTVLELRDTEPWTWVRTHGKGRVFYTAWGHDERTWGHAGFQNLVERGIRWAIGRDPSVVPAFFDKPEMTEKRKDVKPFEYVDANIPFYAPKDGKTEKPRQMQKPLDPAESVKHFVTPVDFEVRTFVTEEKLGGKPLAMTWDERGRLWVSITMDYPNEMQPDGKGRDRIVVCEDTDGDGVCDTVTTFADKLSIPTSLLNVYGGIIVHQAPHTLFLKDTDGDGKADLRQIIINGWGTRDTHAGPSNLRYGLDNWIYGVVGYSAFDGEVNGEKLNFRQGLYRFKLEREPKDDHKLKVSKLEFLRSTSNNSWGIGISEEGHLFGSTANGCASVFMPIPNRYYEKVRGFNPGVLPNIAVDNHIEPITDKVRQVDWHHGFTAAAGHEIYTARTYPKEYWNRVAFICEPTGHLTAAMTIRPDGSSFKTSYGWNLLASDDEWSAPIDAQVGPDGHMWVIDWYNFIVQHNPTPPGFKNGPGNAYETELRDKKHGRIYRVVYTKADKSPQRKQGFSLKDAGPEELVAALKHDNMKWRLHAQRLLMERGNQDVADSLVKLVEDRTVDETGLNAGAVHALYAMHGLGEFRQTFSSPMERMRVTELFDRLVNLRLEKHKSPAVRLASARLFRDQVMITRFVSQDANVEEWPVRVAKLLAASDAPIPENSGFRHGDMIADLLKRDDLIADSNWRDAMAMAIVSHPDTLHYVLSASRPLSTLGTKVVELAVASIAQQKKLDHLFNSPAALDQFRTADPATADAFLTGIAAAWPKDYVPMLDEATQKSLGNLLGQLQDPARSKLVKLAMSWGVKDVAERFVPIVNSLLKTVANEMATDKQRSLAALQVIEFRNDDDDVVTKFLETLSPRSSPELAAGIFDALGNSKSPILGKTVIGKLKTLSPAGRTAALRLLLARTTSSRDLLDAIEKGDLSITELTLEQRQTLSTHPDKVIATRARTLLAKGGGLPNADRQKVIEEVIDSTRKKGDAELGKAVFKAQCAKCHVHGAEGTRIGPDLTGMAVHSKEHLLIDIIDPSRNVEGNFRIYKVTTLDGKLLNGLLASETKTSIEIIDGEAKKHALQRQDIEEMTASNKSLMPEGFEKLIKPDELVNLLEFLTQKGKYLPIPLDKAATVVSTKGMFYSEEASAERIIFPDWTPKLFEGVPFQLVDPRGDKARNVILLHSDNGKIPPTMPKTVTVPCNTAAKAIHLLSGVSGWGSTVGDRKTVSMIVRLHYEDGKKEDHELRDGVHFADYIRRVDVPGSKFAFAVRSQQVRYLAVTPNREAVIKEIEFVKGPDKTAPIVVAVTVETR